MEVMRGTEGVMEVMRGTEGVLVRFPLRMIFGTRKRKRMKFVVPL